jgi:hypothetical protein
VRLGLARALAVAAGASLISLRLPQPMPRRAA